MKKGLPIQDEPLVETHFFGRILSEDFNWVSTHNSGTDNSGTRG